MPERDPATTAAEPPPSFELAMERLETLVGQMENARLPLEELIRSYEEGVGLVRVCNERLSAAEQRIEMITRDAAGQPVAAEMIAAPTPVPKTSPGRETKKLPEPTPPATRPPKNPNEVSLF